MTARPTLTARTHTSAAATTTTAAATSVSSTRDTSLLLVRSARVFSALVDDGGVNATAVVTAAGSHDTRRPTTCSYSHFTTVLFARLHYLVFRF